MTLSEFLPHVERAVDAIEWATARSRWRQGLLDEREAIEKALAALSAHVAYQESLKPLPDGVSFDREVTDDYLEPYRARLTQIAEELGQDVTPDPVPQLPLRSVPMDLITAAVVRRILRLPAQIPVLSLKTLPSDEDIYQAVASIAMRWQSPNAQILTDDV